MSEISILFLFYVFEFIDMLACGAYRFHFLAALWVVDMAIQAGLLLLFFLNVRCCRRMLQHVVFVCEDVGAINMASTLYIGNRKLCERLRLSIYSLA